MACGASLTEPMETLESIASMEPEPAREPQPVSPVSYSQPAQPYAPVRPPKDKSIALILEILPGLFGFLGIGWIYAGETSKGVIWLVGFLIYVIISAIIIAVTAGFGACFTLPINLVLIAVSATSLNKYTKEHPELFG
jgi:TM2 domain-containing membrane protein YozV